jgi:hypothetical protein
MISEVGSLKLKAILAINNYHPIASTLAATLTTTPSLDMNFTSDVLLETLTNMVSNGKADGTSLTFSNLANGIDDSIEILMNNQTGYYNITKTATLISALENGVEGISPQPIQRGLACLREHGLRKLSSAAEWRGRLVL